MHGVMLPKQMEISASTRVFALSGNGKSTSLRSIPHRINAISLVFVKLSRTQSKIAELHKQIASKIIQLAAFFLDYRS